MRRSKIWMLIPTGLALAMPFLLWGVAVLGYQDYQIISAPGNPPSGYLRVSAQTGAMGCLTSAGGNCFAGIGSPLTTKGDLYTYASAAARLPVGTNTYVLTANSGATNGIDWEAAASGFANPMTTLGDIIVGGASGAPNRLGVGTNNYCLVANSGATYGVNWVSCPGGGSGTVTNVATSGPITGGPITNTGTIGCATCTVTVASGTAAMGTGAIASGACAATVTTSATGVATTDNIMVDFNADPTGTTGYKPGAMLTIVKFPTSNNVNFDVCNNTGSSLTPGAVTLNWRVVR